MPPEVIFILVLIVFSILEGALRKKKPPGAGLPPGAPRPPGWPGPDQEKRRVPRAQAPTELEEAGTRETADQMVPEDIWEEIAALARGDVEETLRRRRERAQQVPEPPERVSAPRQPAEAEPSRGEAPPAAPVPTPDRFPRPVEVRSRDPRPRELRAVDAPAAHSGGTEIAEREAPGTIRAIPASPPKPPLTPRQQKQALQRAKKHAEAHHRLRGPHSLRRAIIVREVLGRPLALREYGEEDFWSD